MARVVEPDGGCDGRGVRKRSSLPSPNTSSAPASIPHKSDPRTHLIMQEKVRLPKLGVFSLARRQPAEGIVGDGCGIVCAVCLFLTWSHGINVYSFGAAGLFGLPSGP